MSILFRAFKYSLIAACSRVVHTDYPEDIELTSSRVGFFFLLTMPRLSMYLYKHSGPPSLFSKSQSPYRAESPIVHRLAVPFYLNTPPSWAVIVFSALHIIIHQPHRRWLSTIWAKSPSDENNFLMTRISYDIRTRPPPLRGLGGAHTNRSEVMTKMQTDPG